jgi:hypothetical protein
MGREDKGGIKEVGFTKSLCVSLYKREKLVSPFGKGPARRPFGLWQAGD